MRDLILTAVALAMGVASLVLGIIDPGSRDSLVTLQAIGLTALAIVGLTRIRSVP